MDRDNHYETAFEAYLRDARFGYVAIDESRRASLDDEPVKSLDFIVYGANETRLLIDVKGRRYPGGKSTKPSYVWQNWSTKADIDGLERWVKRFGSGYRGLLVFIYHLLPCVDLPPGTVDLWHWREQRYLMRAIPVEDYRACMRVRSPKWGTVHLSTADFRLKVRPFREFAQPLNPTGTSPASSFDANSFANA